MGGFRETCNYDPRLAHFAEKTKKPLREDFKTLEIRSNCAVLIH